MRKWGSDTGGGSVASHSECFVVQRLRLSKDPVFLPDRVTGLLKIRISEHPYSYCDQLGALLGFPENRSPAFWTKVEGHSSTAICSTRVSFGDALREPDLLSRIECLNTESASRTALAFEAVAHGDADGVASNCYLELSATACGFAIWHVDYLSTETHN